ncbi:thiol reductant ABC exporter subunit CydC [Deinococcus sp. YIM 77859]|uniref:thiol reductant ABC exporter subunit CydC n=1 Tax=Deinococcus sp. YIM 77859 TaxID=1540221 RepID=UPI00068FD400|nr:thiol reductant ABC exporter subunit CydC [Deinococcus sp. YIM 77859]
MSALWHLVWQSLRGQRVRLFGAVLLGGLTVLSSVGLLAVSGALISGAALRPESLLVLLPLITAVRLFGISRAALRYAERLVSHDLTFRLLGQVRARVLAHLARVAPARLLGHRGGDLLARVRSDVDELQGVFLRLLAPALVAALVALVTLALVFQVSPPLALVLFVLFTFAGGVLPVLTARRALHAGRKQNAARAELGAATLETLHGLPDLLACGARSVVERHFTGVLAVLEGAEIRGAQVTASASAGREALGGLGLIAALLLVGQVVADGRAPGPLLAASALGVLASFEAIGNLGSAWAAHGSLSAAARRVQALHDLQPAVQEPRFPRRPPPETTLRFEELTFGYPGAEATVLRGVDLTLRPGERLAIVGPSGSGKSTLLGLALRFWDPLEGRVTLGRVDVRTLSLADLRAHFSWAPQQAEVLDGTLRGNLRLGDARVRDSELFALLADLGLEGLLARLPSGLDGWVGEYGARLSAGERARLSVARALLRPAPLLLLDEPSAHLDEPNARRLLRAVADRTVGRSVLLVTHQPHLLDETWPVIPLGQPDGAERPGPPAPA